MKKIIAIFMMFLISSYSYYGYTDEKGEKVTITENLKQEENIVQDEKALEEIAEEIPTQEENQEKQEIEKQQEEKQKITQEIQKEQEIEKDNNQMQETKVSETAKSNSDSNSGKSNMIPKTETAKTTTEKTNTTIVNSKSETKAKNETITTTTQTKVKETKYLRNDKMIQRIKQVIQNNETEDMKRYGYNIVVDSSIKSQTNQFTFTENRVKTNIRYSFGTIRIYAEDYYSDGQLIMTQCYIL